MSTENPPADSKPNYEERIGQQQALVDSLTKEYEKSPTPALKLQITRRSDTVLHLKNLSKGDPRQRARNVAQKARKYTLGKVIATPDNPRQSA